MKSANLILVIIIISIVVVSLTIIYLQSPKVLQKNTYVMDVKVTDDGIMGFNIDPDGLHFGSMSAGSGGARKLTINHVEEEVIVRVIKKGKISKWVSNTDNFIMKKGEEQTLTFSVSIPKNTPVGFYTGEVTIILQAP